MAIGSATSCSSSHNTLLATLASAQSERNRIDRAETSDSKSDPLNTKTATAQTSRVGVNGVEPGTDVSGRATVNVLGEVVGRLVNTSA